ncbi:MAG: hypothetical protein AABN95_26545, partial [Acidobacteriota bacterium]
AAKPRNPDSSLTSRARPVKEMRKNKSQRARCYRELADHSAVVKKVDDRIVGFAESERQGITTSSDHRLRKSVDGDE